MPSGEAQPPILGYAAAAVCPAVPAQGHRPLLPAVVWSSAPGCLPRRPAGRRGLRDLEAPGGGELRYAVYSPSLGIVHAGARLIPPSWEAFVCATQPPKKALLWWEKKCVERRKKRKRNEIFREKGSEDTLQRLLQNGLPSKLRGKGSVRRNRSGVRSCTAWKRRKGLRGAPAHPCLPLDLGGLYPPARLGQQKSRVRESGGLLSWPCPNSDLSRWLAAHPPCPGLSVPICGRDPSSSHNPGLV